MEVYKFIEPLFTNFGTNNIGELVYKEPYVIGNDTTFNYYPLKGGYPIWDRNIKIKDYIEKAFDTDKPKEYFINKKLNRSNPTATKITKESTIAQAVMPPVFNQILNALILKLLLDF